MATNTNNLPTPKAENEFVITWLREKAEACLGHANFVASHHHVLQNPGIVEVWKFASEFHNEFSGKKFTVRPNRIQFIQ